MNYVVAAKSGRISIRIEIFGFLNVLPQKRHPLETTLLSIKQQKSQNLLDIKWNIHIYPNVLNENIEKSLLSQVSTHCCIP